MYVSYTPPPSGLLATALTGPGKPCNGREADARTRTGDPFITRKAIAPDASPREGTPAPIPTAIHADPPSGPATPQKAPETPPVYAFYTPRRAGHRFTDRFTGAHTAGAVGLACATGHHYACSGCRCRCHQPVTSETWEWASPGTERLASWRALGAPTRTSPTTPARK